jgi:hypothetical protein
MLSNQDYLPDLNGEYYPWVEVYNPTSNHIILHNYFITIKGDELQNWQMPDVILPPGEFEIIYLTNNHSSATIFHAPLYVVNGESAICITDSTNSDIHGFAARCIRSNVSYASPQDGFGWPVIFQTPSPGVSNSFGDWEHEPENRTELLFSQPGGFFKDVVQTALSTDLAEAEIRYTLNSAEEPDLNSSLYTNQITMYNRVEHPNYYSLIMTTAEPDDFSFPQGVISKCNVLRARVFEGGCPASEVFTQNYFVNNSGLNNYKINVAAISAKTEDLFDAEHGIYVFGNAANYTQHGENWEREAILEMYNSEGDRIINQRVAMRIHGAGTREAPQKSLRLYAKSSLGPSYFNYSFFPDKEISKYKRLIIRTTMGDWRQNVFKDELCHYMVRNLNIDYMASLPTILYLNGEYWGIQNLRERQDKYYLQENHHLNTDEFDIVDHYYGYGPRAQDGDLMEYQYLVNFITNNDLNIPENYEQLNDLLDIENAIDYFAAQVYFANLDFPERNYSMWRPKVANGKWRWLFFDCDGCMVRPNFNSLAEIVIPDGSVQINPEWTTLIFRSLMNTDQFRQQFANRLRNLLNDDFSPSEVINAIERFKLIYEPLITEHIERWNYPADYNLWLQYVDELRMFALVRPVEVNKLVERYFGDPFVVYPNPSKGNFTVDFYGNGYTSIQLYNLQGKLIESYFPTSESEDILYIDEKLISGVYILKILVGRNIYTQKLVISN